MEQITKVSNIDQTKAIKFWRSELEKIIDNESLLSKFDVGLEEDDQTVMCIKMEHLVP